MTEPKGVRRRRRDSLQADDIPSSLAQWFAGELPEPPLIEALAYPSSALLHTRWTIWKATHPHAMPPAGFEWLTEPAPERLHGVEYECAVAIACECVQRLRRLGIR